MQKEYVNYKQLETATERSCKNRSITVLGKQFVCNYIEYKENGGTQRHYYFLSDRKKKSWNQARSICSSIGENLPIFTGREQLEELLAVLKLSQHAVFAEAIHIGLTHDSKQVQLHNLSLF